MNTQSNAVPDSPFDERVVAPAAMAATRPFYWSVRRELWENRYIYIAPVAAGGVILFGFLMSLAHMSPRMRATFALDPMAQRTAIEQPYMMAAGFLMLTAMLVGGFYCLEALHGERRDRSILFWKSLPISDLMTVLSKMSIPGVVLQFIAFVVTLAVWWIMLLLSSAVLLGSGMSAAALWTRLPIVQMSAMLLYHLLILHGLWHAPFYAWLLMVSSWAKRAPFLWAVVPPLAIGIAEKIAFNTSYFASMLWNHVGGSPDGGSQAQSGSMSDMLGHFEPVKLLTAHELWAGLAVTAIFLTVAVRLRRDREPV
jgi:ABC-2 type transport system permease protein